MGRDLHRTQVNGRCRENLLWWLGPQWGTLDSRWRLPSRQQALSESYFPSLHGVCLVDQTETASSLLYLYQKCRGINISFSSFFLYISFVYGLILIEFHPHMYIHMNIHTCVCSHMHSNIHKINIHMQLFFFVFVVVLWVFFNVECDVIWYVFPFNWN